MVCLSACFVLVCTEAGRYCTCEVLEHYRRAKHTRSSKTCHSRSWSAWKHCNGGFCFEWYFLLFGRFWLGFPSQLMTLGVINLFYRGTYKIWDRKRRPIVDEENYKSRELDYLFIYHWRGPKTASVVARDDFYTLLGKKFMTYQGHVVKM